MYYKIQTNIEPTFHDWDRQAGLVVARRRGELVRRSRFDDAAELARAFFALLPLATQDDLIDLGDYS